MFALVILSFFTVFHLFSISTDAAQQEVQKAREKVAKIQKEIDKVNNHIDNTKKDYYNLPKISITGKSQTSEAPSFAAKIGALETEIASLKVAKAAADTVLKGTIQTLKTTEAVSDEIASPTITIENKTPIDLYFALYYSKVISTQITAPQFLPAGKRVTIDRPKMKSGYDRQVYFSINDDVLTEELSRGESDLIPNFNIGYVHGETYVIVFVNGVFKGYDILDKAIQPLLQKIEGTFQKLSDEMLKQLRKQYKNPNKGKSASVRTSTDISTQEKNYLAKRASYIKTALAPLVGQDIPDTAIPRIAVCCSGGGYRAMISALGSFIGMEKMGLLNGITYLTGLSGSTWTIAPWTTMGIPLQEFRDQLTKRVNKDLSQEVNTLSLLDTLWKKFVFDEPLSTIDVYGGFLGNRLLKMPKKNPYKITLTKQQDRIADGSWPFPIYTAIATKDPYEWLEFTPYEVGSNYLGGFIPTWAFGCEFKNGKSTDMVPEQHLGFLMGIWGSAFSANIKETYDTYREKIDSPILRDALDLGASYEYFGGVRILPARIANPYFSMISSSRSQQKILTLIDAGLAFNIPIPPLLRKERNIDIIIVLDNSYYITNSPALLGSANYARSKKLPFPPVSIQEIDKKICTVFKDEANPDAPVVIYLPLIKNNNYSKTFDPAHCVLNSYCTTENFSYSSKQVMQLSGLTEYSIQESAPIIMQEIKDSIERKKKR
jgi:phospholipase A2